MERVQFPIIDLPATGENIIRLRKERGMTVRDLQRFFGFEEPRAIYKWQRGESLPTVDNLYALGALLGVSMEEILVPMKTECMRITTEQRAAARCSFFSGRLFGIRQSLKLPRPFFRTLSAAIPQDGRNGRQRRSNQKKRRTGEPVIPIQIDGEVGRWERNQDCACLRTDDRG